jgi:hypothetical protein
MIFRAKARQLSRAERCAMVERANSVLPISQQCRLLAVSRSSAYRKPAEANAEELAIMALIDRQYLARLYHGSPDGPMTGDPRHVVNRKRVQRLMRLPGAGQSGVVLRRYLYRDGKRLPLFGGDYGLGRPRGAGVAAV